MLKKVILALSVVALIVPAQAQNYTPINLEKKSIAPDRQIACIAKNIYFEAGAEPRAGKIAVANVVINRTKSSKFPDTPCKVIHQKSQFSWVAKKPSIKSKSLYEECLTIAREVYYNRTKDNTFGSLFFHAISVKPNWGKKRTTIIGRHIFYK